MVVTLKEAKMYLRVDSEDEDCLIRKLIHSATELCMDVARVDESVCSDNPTFKNAVLYALAYLYEHREEADHHDLTMTLRSILFGVRKDVF